MHKPYIIPEHLDPFRLAEQQIHLHGIIRLKDLERLGQSICNPEGTVDVNLHFFVDEQGVSCVKVQLKTELMLQCQRCMEAFTYGIISDFSSGLVDAEGKAEQLPDSYEPVVVKDSMLPIRELIEDEVILSLPIVPMHVPEDCKVKMPYIDPDWNKQEASPFYVLKQPVKRKT